MLDIINLQSHKGKKRATQIVYCFHTIATTATTITQMKIFSPIILLTLFSQLYSPEQISDSKEK